MATRKRRTTGIKKHVSSTSNRVQRGRTAGPRVGRDGKARVACPGCGTEYMVPEAALDNELRCRGCSTAFVPRSAGRMAAPEKFNATPYYIGGGVLVLIIGIYLATRPGTAPVTPTDAGPPPVVAETGMKNPRVRQCREWGEALHTSNRLNIESLTDPAAFMLRFGITELGAAGTAAVVDRLVTDESTKYFRDFEITSALLGDGTAHDAAEGRVILHMTPMKSSLGVREGVDFIYAGDPMQMGVDFRMEGTRARVIGFEPVVPAQERRISRDSHRSHKEIGEATVVKRTLMGQEVEAVEASIVPLGHLEDTPEPLRKEIDRLIEDVMSDDPPGAANRARLRLEEILKPAVPRLLNKMYETKMETKEDIQALRRICGALEGITGQRFGFAPALTIDGQSTEELRMSALKQWYGYWTTHHDRPDWRIAVEEEESLDFPTSDDKK
ncbi:MAG: hypothetical protein KDB80_04635 [Planctomycetes bacterium]|nr:hypothetical protein [Planctomycetota bacterium]